MGFLANYHHEVCAAVGIDPRGAGSTTVDEAKHSLAAEIMVFQDCREATVFPACGSDLALWFTRVIAAGKRDLGEWEASQATQAQPVNRGASVSVLHIADPHHSAAAVFASFEALARAQNSRGECFTRRPVEC